MRLRMLGGGALLAAGIALAVPLPAFAQAQTTTSHFSDIVSEPDTNPCTGAAGTITETFHGVTHVTGLPLSPAVTGARMVTGPVSATGGGGDGAGWPAAAAGVGGWKLNRPAVMLVGEESPTPAPATLAVAGW